ncbi:MAG: TIGR04141 family sporadically distributed protein, partial [Deltaproteobacteria bacterium]|nr:TIGR04141 family sporadically distributed protein [Deltaproteobacteria bacterium]
MPKSEDKKYKLSIYLIKDSYTDDAQIVPKCGEMNAYEITDEEGVLGTLYIKTDYTSIPKWAEFFSDIFSPEDIKLTTKSARAVLIVNINGRKLCLTFGHAHFLIEPLAIVRNFGLKVALNIGRETSLRAVDKTCLDVVEIKSKEQSSKEVGIENFDFDFETDILKSITAKNEDGSSTLSGRDSVSIGAAVRLDTLRDFISDLLIKYESGAYKTKFSWVDNISEARDKSIVAELIHLLIEKVKIFDPCVWLAIPEVIIWEDVSGFSFKKQRSSRSSPIIRQDIHLEHWFNEVVNDDEVDIAYLK